MSYKKLTEADVTAESVFMLKRRQVLKTLGLGRAWSGPRRPGVHAVQP